jgi:curved DNA-binding protein CbpA
MRLPTEFDHYELLDVARDARAEEVERAYRLAAATWQEDSLATYSLYSEAESAALRERLEQAYRVLSDPDARAAYDRTLEDGDGSPREAPVPLDLELAFEDPPRAEMLATEIGFEASLEEDGAPYDGARLRRSRLERGVEIAQIAAVTKVNPTYLRFLEDEDFAKLPAPVYVRGFVSAYARCLGLDPSRVVPDYMERLEAARQAEGASRLAAGGRRGRR